MPPVAGAAARCRRPPLTLCCRSFLPFHSAVLWQMSAQRKRQEEAERMEVGGSSGRQGLQPAPSGKGDRFFSNLMPSFVKR